MPRKLPETAQRHDVPHRGIGLRGLPYLSHQQARRAFSGKRKMTLLDGAAQVEQIRFLHDQQQVDRRFGAGKLALDRAYPAIDLRRGNARHR